jgi:hypothetical protein
MTLVDKGKFCNSCNKTVVDFTGMSDAQLIAYFKKPSLGSVCGRFNKDQLYRDISQPESRFPLLKYFFKVLVPVFLFSLKAKSQGEKRAIKGDTVFTQSPVKKMDANGNHFEKTLATIPKKLKGQITDSDGKPIVNATVMFKGTRYGALSDDEGHYSISVPENYSKMILVFSSIGFQSRQIEIDSSNAKKSIDVSLVILEEELLGEVIIVKKQSKRKNKYQ